MNRFICLILDFRKLFSADEPETAGLITYKGMICPSEKQILKRKPVQFFSERVAH